VLPPPVVLPTPGQLAPVVPPAPVPPPVPPVGVCTQSIVSSVPPSSQPVAASVSASTEVAKSRDAHEHRSAEVRRLDCERLIQSLSKMRFMDAVSCTSAWRRLSRHPSSSWPTRRTLYAQAARGESKQKWRVKKLAFRWMSNQRGAQNYAASAARCWKRRGARTSVDAATSPPPGRVRDSRQMPDLATGWPPRHVGRGRPPAAELGDFHASETGLAYSWRTVFFCLCRRRSVRRPPARGGAGGGTRRLALTSTRTSPTAMHTDIRDNVLGSREHRQ
jgi:hypothetical protein